MNIKVVAFVACLLFYRYRSMQLIKKDLKKLIPSVVCGLLVFLVFLYNFQDKIVYQNNMPSIPKTPQTNPDGYKNPKEHGLKYEDIYFNTTDGTLLHAWLIFSNKNENFSQKKPLIMFFQGNALNMGFRLPFFKKLIDETGFNVFVVPYRGYGNSEGVPNEENLKNDSLEAWKIACNLDSVDKNAMYAYGRSLGGAVLIDLAHRLQTEGAPFAGVVIENTFTSVSNMVDVLYPSLKIFKSLVLKIKWDSLSKMARFESPALFVSGRKDAQIPPSQMDELFEACGATKKMVLIDEGTHDNTIVVGSEIVYREMREFFRIKI